MQLAEFTRSKEYLMRAGKLAPNNAEIRQELQKLDRYVKQMVRECLHCSVLV